MTLALEAKTWVLKERKRKQQQEDKAKKSSDTNGNDTLKLSKATETLLPIYNSTCKSK
jgi:hypothetical protein